MTTIEPGKITAAIIYRTPSPLKDGGFIFATDPDYIRMHFAVKAEKVIVMTGEEVETLIAVTAAAAVLAARDDLNRSLVRVTTDVAQDISWRVQKALGA